MKFIFAIMFLIVSGCKPNVNKKEAETGSRKNNVITFYSKDVAYTFHISISLPADYKVENKAKYPVVYLLDANLYFDMMATAFNKYAEVGITPAVILIGIGYKDFQTMDSLRNRDYTYPVAIPEYEMSQSGGADKFLKFINNELTPYVDHQFNCDTTKRVLMGHSLGGYFVTYTLQQYLAGSQNYFSAYIAASPSIHYNNYYLLSKFMEPVKKMGSKEKIRLYVTFGGLEDEEENDPGMMKVNEVCRRLSELFMHKHFENIMYKNDIYSNLGHMDTPIPTFIKGLQWALKEDGKSK